MPRVDDDGFWTLIDQCAATGGGSSVEAQIIAVTTALGALPDADVRRFDRRLRAQVARANDWRLWAAGYLAAGGMSDDAFTDFRVWLVYRGRATFERVLADPDSLADLAWSEDGEDFADAEELLYVPGEVLESRGREEDDEDGVALGGAPTGDRFPEDDDAWFAAALPRLWARKERAAGA